MVALGSDSLSLVWPSTGDISRELLQNSEKDQELHQEIFKQSDTGKVTTAVDDNKNNRDYKTGEVTVDHWQREKIVVLRKVPIIVRPATPHGNRWTKLFVALESFVVASNSF